MKRCRYLAAIATVNWQDFCHKSSNPASDSPHKCDSEVFPDLHTSYTRFSAAWGVTHKSLSFFAMFTVDGKFESRLTLVCCAASIQVRTTALVKRLIPDRHTTLLWRWVVGCAVLKVTGGTAYMSGWSRSGTKSISQANSGDSLEAGARKRILWGQISRVRIWGCLQAWGLRPLTRARGAFAPHIELGILRECA